MILPSLVSGWEAAGICNVDLVLFTDVVLIGSVIFPNPIVAVLVLLVLSQR